MKLSKYLNQTDAGYVFNSTSLVIYIPTSYTNYKMLTVQDIVTTLAIFDFEVDGEKGQGLFIPAIIETCPSTIGYITINGTQYLKCEYTKGDVFIKSKLVVKNPYIAYVVFKEFVQDGRISNFIDYDACAFLFDTVKEITGSSIPADHAIFEMIFAHLMRDADSVRTPYRLTNQSKPPKFIKLQDTAHASISATSKFVGGYLNDGINSMLVNANDTQSDLEDLLRQ